MRQEEHEVIEAAKGWLTRYADEVRDPSEEAPCKRLVSALDTLAALPAEKRDGVIDAVRGDLHARSQLGIKKYGTTLEENSADHQARLQHAYEECLDMANYLKWAIMQIDKRRNIKPRRLGAHGHGEGDA